MPVPLGVGRQASYVAGYVERRVLSSLLEGKLAENWLSVEGALEKNNCPGFAVFVPGKILFEELPIK